MPQSLPEMRALAKEVLEQGATPQQQFDQDQALALWRDRLTTLGVDLGEDQAIYGLLAGLKMAQWCVDNVFRAWSSAGDVDARELLGDLLRGLSAGQTLVLNIQPDTLHLPEPTTQEGVSDT
ncbi:MAG: hypothetical protein ACXVYY_01100 [Oryzihumus sp.]